MDKIVPPAVRPLAEVKDKAIAAWQAEKRSELVAKEAEALAAAVKPGTQLSAVAAAKGLKATTSPPFQRQSEDAAGCRRRWSPSCSRPNRAASSPPSDATGSYVAQLAK